MAHDAETHATDVAVVGAGTGGYVAAIRGAQLGLDVTLVEGEAFGGTCLNYGCIPSKALIHATDVAYEADNAAAMGVYADPEVDFGEMVAWKEGVVDTLTGAVEKLCKANRVNLVEGWASFEDEHTLSVDLNDGDTERYEFEHAIVATGSRPIEVPGFAFDGEHILSSREALALEDLPDSMLVVGAGYIGMELSTVFAKLGVDVTVIEMLDEMLPGYDRELTRPVETNADEYGIDFEFGQAASDWEATDTGVRLETETKDGETFEYEAETVVVAVGREPVTDSANLEALGVEIDENGFVETDDQCRTDTDHVFAIGDVAGEPLLAHAGSAEGEVAAAVIAGEMDASMADRPIPAAVFTDPEIAMVGLSESEAAEAGHETMVGEFPFRSSGRALSTGHDEGFVRIVADEGDGTVLGAQIVGPKASELIAELALAVETGATVETVAETIHTHPTLAESSMEAAENALGHAIHALNR